MPALSTRTSAWFNTMLGDTAMAAEIRNILNGNVTGNVFFVSSVTGSDGNNGLSSASPLATLNKALTLCTASNGDRIYLLPGHAESIIAAGTIAINVAGVRIIGLGQGDARPTFSWTTATTATMTITSNDAWIENVRFDLTGISALVSGIVISAAGVTITGCLFITAKAGTGTAPSQSILTTAGANRLTLLNNHFLAPALTPTTVAAATGVIALVGGTGIRILNNVIGGWCTTTTGPISCVTTLTDNIVIDSNQIMNWTTSATKAISLLTGSSGVISNNRLGVGTGSAPITADTCYWLNNYYAGALATAGTIL
jgi:hypothetical protein